MSENVGIYGTKRLAHTQPPPTYRSTWTTTTFRWSVIRLFNRKKLTFQSDDSVIEAETFPPIAQEANTIGSYSLWQQLPPR